MPDWQGPVPETTYKSGLGAEGSAVKHANRPSPKKCSISIRIALVVFACVSQCRCGSGTRQTDLHTASAGCKQLYTSRPCNDWQRPAPVSQPCVPSQPTEAEVNSSNMQDRTVCAHAQSLEMGFSCSLEGSAALTNILH